jgi:hypothetical protein
MILTFICTYRPGGTYRPGDSMQPSSAACTCGLYALKIILGSCQSCNANVLFFLQIIATWCICKPIICIHWYVETRGQLLCNLWQEDRTNTCLVLLLMSILYDCHFQHQHWH